MGKKEQKKQEILDYLVKDLREYLPGPPGDYYIVEVRSVIKENNQKETGVSVTETSGRHSFMLYLDDIIEGCKTYYGEKIEDLKEMDFERISSIAEGKVEQAFEKLQNLEMETIVSYAKIAQKIRLCICEPRLNTEMLKNLVYDIKGDFAQYYMIHLDSLNVKVSKSMLKMWDVPKKSLYKRALENMEQEVKFTKCIEELHPGVDEVEADNIQLYILSNQNHDNGAAVIMHPKVQCMVAEKMKGDYYVMPVSRHHLMVLPDSCAMSLDDITAHLKWNNTYQIPRQDYLSDQIQHYSAYAHVLENAYRYQWMVKEYPQKYGKKSSEMPKTLMEPIHK